MLTATSKLDAINTILSSIGADPVNTIDEEIDVDVANAVRIMDRVSRDIQRQGWDFNTYALTLSPEAFTNRIPWIPTIISFKATDGGTYAKRDNYFFDVVQQTYTFTHDIQLSAIMAIDFDDLPDCFRNYIAARAALTFQAHFMGDASLSQDLTYAAQEAYQDIVSYDMHMGDYNMLNYIGVSPVLERS